MPYFDGYNVSGMYAPNEQDMQKYDRDFNRNIPYAYNFEAPTGINFGVSHTMDRNLANVPVPNQPTPTYKRSVSYFPQVVDNLSSLMRGVGNSIVNAIPGMLPGYNMLSNIYNTYRNSQPPVYEERFSSSDNWPAFNYNPNQQNPSMYQQGTIPNTQTMYGGNTPMGIYPPAYPIDVEKL